jgi:repressor of nif and glnA expression
MKTIENMISETSLHELSTANLVQISGGSWLGDAAEFVGFAVGTVAHAVVDGVLLVTGNFGDHK